MPFKKRTSQSDPTERPEGGAFWASPTTEPTPAGSSRQKFSDQIARLQQKQMELVQQTAAELESLKYEIENGRDVQDKVEQAKQPLLAEIAGLRRSLQEAEEKRSVLSNQVNHVRTQAQTLNEEMREFFFKTGHGLEQLFKALDSIDAGQPVDLSYLKEPITYVAPQPTPTPTQAVTEPRVAVPTPAATESAPILTPNPASQPITFERLEEKLHTENGEVAEKPRREKKSHKGILSKRFAVRVLSLAVILGGGYFGFSTIKNTQPAEGSVAGVSTTSNNSSATTQQVTDPEQQYAESYAEVPFDKTQWETDSETDLGISLIYPKNASNRVRAVGGNNLWFLRKNGYLMKFTMDETAASPEAWIAANKDQYPESEYRVNGGQIGTTTVSIITPLTQNSTTGTIYIARRKTGVLLIWVKNEDQNTDDGKRVIKMFNSIQLTNQN